MSPFDPNPRKRCPDPQLGTRAGWVWCADCGGVQAPGHTHEGVRMWTVEELLLHERAESLLCALAFDHRAGSSPTCALGWCVFCGAEPTYEGFK